MATTLNKPLFKHKAPIRQLLKFVGSYLPRDEVKLVLNAYNIAKNAHQGQFRNSGEAYLHHPVQVAITLAKLNLDSSCIVAALLHDCIEDTVITYDDIVNQFGKEIAFLVKGVTKLEGLKFRSVSNKQAQNFRKLFLAMSGDLRVIIIKLSDRLHNMRTIASLPVEKQKIIAMETMNIHAPIAHELSLNQLRLELEDLAFEVLYPYRASIIKKYIKHRLDKRQNVRLIKKTIAQFKDRLKKEGLEESSVSGRTKQPYSIYKKMKSRKLGFDEVFDVLGFRIIVKNISQCYLALGVIHNLYKPMPEKFKDYIAAPKRNGYQSLHTILFGPNKIFIEVQIRTEEMDFISQFGIAAHWHYKEHADSLNKANKWVKTLLNIHKRTNNSIEFLEQAQHNMLPSEVYVFTPQGEIIQMPAKSTALDFAYTLHTDIGNHTTAVKINQAHVPLDTVIMSGQMIEIITSPTAKPHPSWIKTAVTIKAKNAIKAQLKNLSKPELMRMGKYLLVGALEVEGLTLETFDKKQWKHCLTVFRCKSRSDIYIKIALSELLVSIVLSELKLDGNRTGFSKHIKVRKTEGKSITFAKCCYPLPGDSVSGILTTHKGLVMHRTYCQNLQRAKQKNAQWLKVDWRPSHDEKFETLISVDVASQRGVLAIVADVITSMNIDIEHLEIQEEKNEVKSFNFIISVRSVEEVKNLCNTLLEQDCVLTSDRL